MSQAVAVVHEAARFAGKRDSEALALLDRPTIVHLRGRSQKKAVLVSVILHGSEPCGFRAFLREAQLQRQLNFDVYFFIGNIAAAQKKPIFSNRFVPGDANYNRIWGSQTKHPVAREVCAFFEKIPLIAVLDIHSFTTKKNIPHCFIASDNDDALQLSKALAPHVFISDVPHGTLIEHFGSTLPACTVECGTNNTAEADAYAAEALERFFRYAGVLNGGVHRYHAAVYDHETNIKIRAEASVCWAMSKKNEYDVTLRSDCEAWNLSPVKAGSVLGWADSLKYFCVSAQGTKVTPESVFRIEKGAIVLARDCVPTLLSTSEFIAKESGFYLFETRVPRS